MKFFFPITMATLSTATWSVSGEQSNLRRAAAAPLPPNVDQVTYGFNLLLGKTPAEQRESTIGSKLFTLSVSQGRTMGGYAQPDQVEDMSTSAQCYASDQSHHVWYALSSSSLISQAKTSSHGWDQSTNVGVSVPVGPATLNAETTIRTALLFGNSKSSSHALEQASKGFTYSFDAKSQRSLYHVQVDYESINSWTPTFNDKCKALNNNPTTVDVLKFFQAVGTHALEKASFGQSCTSTLFMEGGETMSSYYDIFSESKNFEASLYFWRSSTSSSSTTSEQQDSANGFQYFVSNRQCEGELSSPSSCTEKMVAGKTDAPAIIDWSYKPIWEMRNTALNQATRNKMKQVFENVLKASVRCSESHCNGNGACVPNEDAWKRIGNFQASNSLDTLFNSSKKCFCDDSFEGDTCQEGRSIRVDTPRLSPYFQNDWDGVLSFNNGNPMCGMLSEHNNAHQDRRFNPYTCAVKEPGTEYGQVTGRHVTEPTRYDQPMNINCEGDKVLQGLYSYHSNYHEDRMWTGVCAHFKNTQLRNCEGYDIANPSIGSYRNSFDGTLDYKCPAGKVLTGIHSVHSNKYEDRIWKFRCCEMQVTEEENPNQLLVKSGWNDYLNSFDGNLEVYFRQSNGRSAAVCGVASEFSGRHRDRRYRFQYCTPKEPVHSTFTYFQTSVSHAWAWDGDNTFTCPANSFISSFSSVHSNKYEDRVFWFSCAKWTGYYEDMCYWTDWVNDFHEISAYECGDQFVMKGVRSYHSNKYEDRRWKFQCCRFSKH